MYKFNQEEFDNTTNKDLVTCWCKNCGVESKRLKIYIKHNIKHNVDKFDCYSCKEKERQETIIKNTKTCPTCNISFINPDNVYCSQSCAATTSNRRRKRQFSCIRCNKELKYNHKFCSDQCSGLSRSEERRKKTEPLILKGEIISKNIECNNAIYRRYLIEKFGPKCMKCGWSETNRYTGKIPIELEHKDGNCVNNDLSNLELLCPNCHSLSQFYKGANKKEGGSPRYKAWKQYFSS